MIRSAASRISISIRLGMNDTIAIRPSRKAGLCSDEKYIITFGNIIVLRILKDGEKYAVVTATADEDDKQFLAPTNQALFIDLALRTAEALGVKALMCRDNYGRDFVNIYRCDNEEDASQVFGVFRRLFLEHMNANQDVDSEAQRELRDIYEEFSPDDGEDEAYLGDGVSIGRGGSWIDRG